MKDIRKTVFDNLIHLIKKISDAGYQANVWLKENATKCDSFDETICELFPTLRDVIAHKREYCLSQSQLLWLNKLFQALESFSSKMPEYYNDRQIVSDSEWRNIISLATEALTAFKEHPFLKKTHSNEN